jgi:hypothetical protein
VTRRLLMVLLLPLLIGLAATIPARLISGSDQWLFFAIAFGLCVPAGLIVVLLHESLVRSSPFGRVVSMGVGTFVRLAICFGGGVIVFLVLRPEERGEKIAFWAWILFAYLTSLVVEMAALAKSN